VGRSNLGFVSGAIVGHYRTAAISGLVAGAAAGSTLFSARYAPSNANYRAVLQRLRIQMAIISPFTAAQEIYLAAFKVHGFSAADTGGTALTLTAPNAMLNDIADIATSMSINVATTGALTAGTRTVDAQPFLVALGSQTFTTATAVQAAPFAEEYVLNSDQQYPFNLQGAASLPQNSGGGTAYGPEGIIVQCGIALGAGGTVRCSFEMEWVEYDATTNVGGSLA
jgi:hypothetical protein